MTDTTTQSKLHGPARRQQRQEEADRRNEARAFRSTHMQLDELSCRLGLKAEGTSEHVRLLQGEADRLLNRIGNDQAVLVRLFIGDDAIDLGVEGFLDDLDDNRGSRNGGFH